MFNIPDGDVAALVSAVQTANGNNQPDTINLAAGGTYTFTTRADATQGGSALPQIALDGGNRANSLTINGHAATVERSALPGTPGFRFMKIGPSISSAAVEASDVVLTGLTVRNFDARVATDAAVPSGGALRVNRANVRLTDCVLTGNAAQSSGAIVVLGSSTLALTLERCTITDNLATSGAIVSVNGATLVVTGTTIADNRGLNGGVSFQGGTICSITDTVIRNNPGAGVDASGSVALTRVTVADNGRFGGRVVGSLSVADSTISGNGFGAGGFTGGISLLGSAGAPSGLTITNSTIHGNRGAFVGGVDVDAGQSAANGFRMTVTHTTITGNVSTAATANAGGVSITGLTPWPDAEIGHTVIAGNTSSVGAPDLFGTFNSLGYVAIGDAAGATNFGSTAGNQFGTAAAPLDPGLGPLATNGGPTPTRVPLAGSPLIDAGDPAFAPPPAADQRGRPRVQGGRVDIGAAEMAVVPTVVAVRVNDGSAQRSAVRSLTVTFSDAVSFAGGDGNAAAAFTVSRAGGGGNVGLTAAISASPSGQTVVTLTFTNANPAVTDPFPGGPTFSLADGRYRLAVADGVVTNDIGPLDGDANGTAGGAYLSPDDTAVGGPGQLRLYRLFGDATGDGAVDLADLGVLRSTFNAGVGNPAYLDYLDADYNGTVDLIDLGRFRSRFNASVFV